MGQAWDKKTLGHLGQRDTRDTWDSRDIWDSRDTQDRWDAWDTSGIEKR